MELSDDLLMAIYLADNIRAQECVGLGWGEGSFEEDVTDEVYEAWDAAVQAGARLWLSRHEEKDHPWVEDIRRHLKATEG